MLRFICLLLLLSATFIAQASNRLYADNTLDPSDGFAWDWSLGLSYYGTTEAIAGIKYTDGLEAHVNLTLSYNDFYLDIDHSQLSGGVILGYNLIEKYDWSLDILTTDVAYGFNEFGLYYNQDQVIDELSGIDERHSDFGAGLRLTRSFGPTQISFEVLHDISGAHQGLTATGFVSTIKDWRNWEFRFGGGYQIYSSDYTQYYYGISPHEATQNRPVYEPSTGYSLLAEFHSEVPINEDWVFLSGLLAKWYSRDITQSPIVEHPLKVEAKIGVRYVF